MEVIEVEAFDTVESTDGKRECPDCHKRLTVTQAGNIRGHNCINGPTSGKARQPRKGGKTKRSSVAPESVTKLSRALIASGVEAGTRHLVSRAADCSPDAVPAELPDAAAMIDPFITVTWPSVPARAQSIITRISEHEDLILACVMWWQYMTGLQKFIRQANASREDNTNGVSRSLAPIAFGTARPFQPIPPIAADDSSTG